jgi:hypothetical protein
MSPEDYVRTNLTGSVVVSWEEKKIFSQLTGTLRRLNRLLTTLSADPPTSSPGGIESPPRSVEKLVPEGDRSPLVRELRRAQELAERFFCREAETPARRELRREALLEARRASRVATRLLAGGRRRTDLLRRLVGILWILAASVESLVEQ